MSTFTFLGQFEETSVWYLSEKKTGKVHIWGRLQNNFCVIAFILVFIRDESLYCGGGREQDIWGQIRPTLPLGSHNFWVRKRAQWVLRKRSKSANWEHGARTGLGKTVQNVVSLQCYWKPRYIRLETGGLWQPGDGTCPMFHVTLPATSTRPQHRI